MRSTLALLALALVPVACGGSDPTVAQPAQPVVVDLDARPAPPPSAAPTPAQEAPEKKAEAPPEAQQYGMIGLLNAGAGGDPSAPTAPWGRDDPSVQGNMWGSQIGDASGVGGLGLTGVGPSAGGAGQGIGLGSIGPGGLGHGTGSVSRKAPPKITAGSTTVTGRLPPEVIQRIVRMNFGRFRLCYEQGLRKNPKLEGRVVVKFTIGKDGAVTAVSDNGSTMPDKDVTACVAKAFFGLSFPQPEGGIVVVSYPLQFNTADDPPPAPAPKPVAPAPAKQP
jgi:hypothetical protein